MLPASQFTGTNFPIAPLPIFQEYDLQVDYEITTDMSHWKKGAMVTPSPTHGRVSQLSDFWRLFNGDYMRYGLGVPVKQNFHILTSNFLADLLMSFQPEYQDSEGNELDDELIRPRFIQTLNRALANAIVDFTRFGTALFYISNRRYGPEVTSPVPIRWFPADEMSSVLVTKHGNKGSPYELFFSYDDGSVEHERYKDAGGQLGDLLSNDGRQQVGDDAKWAVIQEFGSGRVGTIMNVVREPSTGDWGRSLYRDITSLAFEYNRRIAANSDTLTVHGNPLLLALLDPDSVPFSHDITQSEPLAKQAEMELKTLARRLDTWRKTPIATLPSNFKDLFYVQWTGSLRDHKIHIDEIKEQIFAITNIPAALYGLGLERIPPTGVALGKQFIRTHIYIKSIQNRFLATLRKVLLTGALYSGATVEQLRWLGQNMVIVWRNIFDEQELVNEARLDVDDAITARGAMA